MNTIRLIFSGVLILLASVAGAQTLTNPETALSDYVAYDDGQFNLSHIASIPSAGFTAHLFQMTSQRWMTEEFSDKSIWTHTLAIIIPDTVNTTTSLLYVGSGDNDDPLPDASDQTLQVITQLAIGSQSIVSAVLQVPNQPIIFAEDSLPRKEDRLVSYTWDKSLDTGNYAYTAYLPMVKSVVKAMDAVQVAVPALGSYQVDNFVLTGFSKRGAAVWLTAAVDPRVKAIAPGVIDLLNIVESFEHHYKSYGFFSSAIDDYVDLGITNKLRAPEFSALAKVVDPYNYRNIIDMPKFLLNSSGDQFFLPDSSKFYLDDLKGETMIRFAPNTDHSLSNSQTGIADSLYSLLGWYQGVLYNVPRPQINWRTQDNQLVATTSFPPVAARVWRAYNPDARDFRRETIGESWVPSLVFPDAEGNFIAEIESSNGYHAVYIEFVYQGLAGLPLTYSTQVVVSPDTYPFTLYDQINNPQAANYWRKELTQPSGLYDFDSYLPIPMFADILASLDDLYDALSLNKMESFSEVAAKECTATRLNIKSGKLGWYSPVRFTLKDEETPLWKRYQVAHDAVVNNHPFIAAYICRGLNRI